MDGTIISTASTVAILDLRRHRGHPIGLMKGSAYCKSSRNLVLLSSHSQVFQRVSRSQRSTQRQGLTGSNEADDFDGLTSGPSLSGVLGKTSQTNIGLTGGLERRSTESDDFALPPIVPQITNKDPVVDLSALMYGFQVTKPYTFSYHTSASRICLDAASEKPRKKR